MSELDVAEIRAALEEGNIDIFRRAGAGTLELLLAELPRRPGPVAKALALIGDPRAVQPLIEHLNPWTEDELRRQYRDEYRLPIARALVQLSSPQALRPIAQLLRNRQLKPGSISATWIAEELLNLLAELLEATAADASDEDLRYLAKLRKPRQLRCFSGESEPGWVEELDTGRVRDLARAALANRG